VGEDYQAGARTGRRQVLDMRPKALSSRFMAGLPQSAFHQASRAEVVQDRPAVAVRVAALA